jgi:hypothetical protein
MEGGDPSVAHWCLTLSMMGQEVYPSPVHDTEAINSQAEIAR